MKGRAMTILLSPDTQKLLEDKLKTGQFRSADDVVHAALEALDSITLSGIDERTLAAIDEAEDQIDEGMVHDWGKVRENIRSRFMGN